MHIKNKLFCSNSINPEPKRKPKHKVDKILNEDRETAVSRTSLIMPGRLVQDIRQMVLLLIH